MKKNDIKESLTSVDSKVLLKKKMKSVFRINEFTENLIDTIREPLLALDNDLRVVKASRSFYDVFKTNPEETIGTLIYDLGNRQWDIPKLKLLLEMILPEKATFDSYEVEHNFPSIGKRIMLLNARQIKRAYRKEEKIILLAIEDITEHKETKIGPEKTLKEMEAIRKKVAEVSEFAENIIDSVREPLLALDQDLRIVKASQSFYDFFKVNSADTIGALIYDLGNKQWDIPKLKEMLEKILPQKTTFDNFEIEHNFSTIGKRIMLLNARQIKRAYGKKKIILLAIEDITERRVAEKLLQEASSLAVERTNQLEVANKELEAFSYSVSHDLKAPIRAIDGFSHIILERYSSVLDDEGKRLLSVVLKSTKSMGALIDDLLAFSNLGRKKMESCEINMEELAKEVLKELSDLNKDKKPEITIKHLPAANGDRALLRQVIINLLSNSIKFSASREEPKIEIGNFIKDHQNIYYIKDNGVGFNMKYSDKLFEVFQRLHSTSEFEGTGVGLAIVQRIILRHGGTIWAESEVDKGAAFYFTLTNIGGI